MFPQIPWIKESASIAEFVECVCDAGEIEGYVRCYVFDVEGDDLLFEEEKMLD